MYVQLTTTKSSPPAIFSSSPNYQVTEIFYNAQELLKIFLVHVPFTIRFEILLFYCKSRGIKKSEICSYQIVY